MYRLILLFTLSFISLNVKSQECGTLPNEEQIDFANSLVRLSEINSHLRIQESYLARIPLKIHIVRKSDGTGGLTESQLTGALQRVNSLYKNSNMEFFVSGPINYIDSDTYYDFQGNNEENIGSVNDVPRNINVYFFNTLTSGGPLCGYTYLPPSADRVMLANGCVSSGDTFAHELGHYFSLFHTHGKSNNGTTDELVNGSNCTTAGDNICDTPADPNLSGKVNSNCQYTGTLRDSNGDTYSPMVSNIMSYASECRKSFTPGQYARARMGFEEGRNYLNFVVDGFRALFVAESTKSCVGSTIKFRAQTNAAQKWQWEFPGGSPTTSSFENPSVTYTKAGVYPVRLKVTGSGGLEDEIVKNSLIRIEDPLQGALEESLYDDFDLTELSQRWEIENNDYGLTYTISPVDGDGEANSNSLFINNYEYFSERPSNTDILVSPNFETEGVKSFTIKFSYAYTYRPITADENIITPEITDTLSIGINKTCVNTFTSVWKKGGANLATAPPSNEFFTPTTSQWKEVVINVPVIDIPDGFMNFGIINKSYNGNNLYIDNLQIIADESVSEPLNFRQSNTGNGIVNLRWIDNSTNELQFIIERAVNEGDYTKYDSVGMNTTLYEDINIEQGNIYKYRIYAQGRNNGRSEYTEEVEVSFAITSTEQLINDTGKGYLLYPNPSTGVITIAGTENSDQVKEIRIINLQGNFIFGSSVKSGNGNKQIIAIDHLAKGVYVVELRTVKNNKYQYRIIKK